jgi:hypothetical protein
MTAIARKPKGGFAERVRYFPRQIMTVDDMQTEQDYFVERMRRHNRLLHGWGIACGLKVLPYATADKPWQVQVCPGAAYSATGDEIYVPCAVPFDLASPPDPGHDDCEPCPCPPNPLAGAASAALKKHYLAVRYACRPARPVRTGRAGCGCSCGGGCGDQGCETSRWRDDFELGVLDKLEGPYAPEWSEDEKHWFDQLAKDLPGAKSLLGLPTRPCPPATDYPWVILATIEGDLTAAPGPGTDPQGDLTKVLKGAEVHRRPLLQVEDLVELVRRQVP